MDNSISPKGLSSAPGASLAQGPSSEPRSSSSAKTLKSATTTLSLVKNELSPEEIVASSAASENELSSQLSPAVKARFFASVQAAG